MIAKCPGCGAPPAPGATVCRYCNSPLNAPPQRGPSQPAPARSSAATFVWVIWGLVITATVAGSSLWYRAVGGPGGAGLGASLMPAESPNGLYAAVRDPSGRDDVIVHYYRDGKYVLGRADGVSLAQIWDAPPGDRNMFTGVVADANSVYLAAGERLRAYDLATGQQRWDVGLVAEIQNATNLKLVGDSVVTWQKDKSLQAFDTGSGAVRWTRKTSDAGDRLTIVAGKVLADAENDETSFVLVDPKTGVAGPPAYVSCDPKKETFASSYDNLQQADVTPDGSTLVLASGIHELCLARWDPAAAKPAWTHKLKDSVRVGWFERDAMRVDAVDAFLAGDDVLLAHDLATGKQRDLAREADANFRLRVVHEDTVLAVFWPDYDSRKLSLRAFARDGAQRWQHRLVATDSGGRDWGVYTGPGVVYVWQSSEEDRAVMLDKLSVKTGELIERKPLTDPSRSGITPSFHSSVAAPTRAWMTGGTFATIDLTSGATQHN